MTLAGLFISCLILGALGAWSVSLLGLSLGLIDSPNGRSSHRRPTPRGGGLGILAAFALMAIYGGLPSAVWLPLMALALWAFLGDYIDFSPMLRLAGQLLLAALIVIFTSRLPAEAAWFWISVAFWTAFIVGTANFYNFMDGINGIAGLTGVVGFALLAAYIYLTNKPILLGEVALGISLACLGFLPFNVPKARVFMGDVGSILLGGAFGCLVYLASDNFLDFACLAAFLFPFYVDELTTMVVRLRDGARLTQAHRRHLYQLLANEKGWPHWLVSLGFGVLQLLVGLTILLAKLYYPGAVVVMLSCYVLGFAAATYHVRRQLDNLPAPPKCGAKAGELSGNL
jgi:Fuc2NAc and GlcNAc transferase